MNLANITYKRFKSVIGDSLSINAECVKSVELTSVEVKRSHEGTERIPFALTFRGPADALLPQSIYVLKHKKLGKLEIFLVPVEQDKEHVFYEAIFN